MISPFRVRGEKSLKFKALTAGCELKPPDCLPPDLIGVELPALLSVFLLPLHVALYHAVCFHQPEFSGLTQVLDSFVFIP